MLPRSPVEEQRMASAVAQVRDAARHYWQVQPHPFGQLQTSIRNAKLHGATCKLPHG